jgi:hypothetical protein
MSIAHGSARMPWLKKTWKLWWVTVLRDDAGAFYLRWGRNPPRRLMRRSRAAANP